MSDDDCDISCLSDDDCDCDCDCDCDFDQCCSCGKTLKNMCCFCCENRQIGESAECDEERRRERNQRWEPEAPPVVVQQPTQIGNPGQQLEDEMVEIQLEENADNENEVEGNGNADESEERLS